MDKKNSHRLCHCRSDRLFSDTAWTVQTFVAILIMTVDEYGVERTNECGRVHGAQDFLLAWDCGVHSGLASFWSTNPGLLYSAEERN